MQVALDIRATQSRQHGERGVARYTRGLVDGLLAVEAPLAALLLDPNQPRPEPMPESWTASGLLVEGTAADVRRLSRPFALHRTSPFEMGRPVGAGTSAIALRQADRMIATVHDLIPAAMPEIYLQDHAVRRAYETRLRTLREAELLFAISDDCRNDIIDLLGMEPERVVNVYSATDQPPSPTDPGDDAAILRAELPELRREAVLSITGYEPRKNTHALIDAYSRLGPDVRRETQLVLVCSITPEGRDAWRACARGYGLADDEVLITGKVSDRLLSALHRAAALEVFPSLAEGFGLPVLEAAHARTPVITANTTATPEILALPASTFDPRDVDDMAERIDRALHDEDLRAEIVVAGDRAIERYTWEQVARRTVDAYARLDARTTPRTPPRRRVALVGPFPPAVSGVATYNARVAAALGRQIDLTVLSEHADWRPGDRSYRLHPIEALGEQIDPASFDRTIHTLGNSLVHRRTLLDALDRPDVVWFHETDLLELHVLTARQVAEESERSHGIAWLEQRLAANGSDPALASALFDGAAGARDGVPPMIKELARSANVLITQTPVARSALGAVCRTPIEVIPHAVPTTRDLLVPERAPTDPPTIATFGILSDAKRPDAILEAFTCLRRERAATLAFVGPCDDDLRQRLEAAAAAHGVSDDVVITGHVDARAYGEWLARTSVAVQLRRGDNGAQSGAVADALGAGIPLVTDMEVERSRAAGFVERGSATDDLARAIGATLDGPRVEASGLDFGELARRITGLLGA